MQFNNYLKWQVDLYKWAYVIVEFIVSGQLSMAIACLLTIFLLGDIRRIPAKPLDNHDIVSGHFNNFPCTGIYDKVSSHLSMLTYIYLNVDEH